MAKDKGIIMSPSGLKGSSSAPPKGTTVNGAVGYGAEKRSMGANSQAEVTYDKNTPSKGSGGAL